MVEMLMMHDIFLNGLLRIRLSFRRLVLFLDIHFLIIVHFMLDCFMLLFGVICVILLTMKLICVLIMHAMHNLTLYHPGTIPKLS